MGCGRDRLVSQALWLPPTDRHAQAEVRFDGVYMNSEVWINGQSLGTHPYGYTSFAYDLTPFLKQDGENVLAVRVRNEGANSRWYSGSGIYRHVWLTLTGEVRIPLWGIGVTTPKISPELSVVEVSIEVENRSKIPQGATVRTRIVGPHGEPAGAGEKTADIPAGGKSIVVAVTRCQACAAVVIVNAAIVPGRNRACGGRESGRPLRRCFWHSQYRGRYRAWPAHQRGASEA